jgi:AraC family transcriptional activator of pobA
MPSRPAKATPTRRLIPSFALYGEAAALGAEVLHVEEIQSRSKLYHWEIDAHVHQGLHQILWLASGPAGVSLDTERSEAAGPAAVVIPPGAVHAFRFAPETDGYVLTLGARRLVEGDNSAVGEALQSLFAAPRLHKFDAADLAVQRVQALFDELAAEFRMPDMVSVTGNPVLPWLARAVVWRLAQLASREAQQQDNANAKSARRQQDVFTRFTVLLEAHYLEHWPISRYASRLGLTPERLNRLTRAQCGHSALELLHDRIAREACRRLVYIAAPIIKLAFELGFDDPAYFCRFFKRRIGASPSDYREQHAAQ